jgi:hypothetical protein
MKKNLLIISFLLIGLALFSANPRTVVFSVTENGTPIASGDGITVSYWILDTPGEVSTIWIYMPPFNGVSVDLQYFVTPWSAGDVLHCEVTKAGITGIGEVVIPNISGAPMFPPVTPVIDLVSGPTPPVLATLVAPGDGDVVPIEAVLLDWAHDGANTTGYEVWFGTADVEAAVWVADVLVGTTEYNVGDLAESTDYEWYILPYYEELVARAQRNAVPTKSRATSSSRAVGGRIYPDDPQVTWYFSTFDPTPDPPPATIPPALTPTSFPFNGGTGTGGAGSTVTLTPPANGGGTAVSVTIIDPVTTGIPFPENVLPMVYSITGYTGDFPIHLEFTWDYPAPSGTGLPMLLVSTDGGATFIDVTNDPGVSGVVWNLVAPPYSVSFDTMHLSDWAIGNGEDNPLPVTLSSFTASVIQNEFVALNWTTQSETNMLGYKVYRSQGSIEQADFVSDLIDAENNTIETNYNFEDHEVYPLILYNYWLQSIDNDGSTMNFGPLTAEIEEVLIPELPQSTVLKGNYPNPFNPTTFIKFDVKENESAKLIIYNMKGQIVESKSFEAGTHNYEWNADKVTSGVYFYKLQSDSYRQIKKMLLLK